MFGIKKMGIVALGVTIVVTGSGVTGHADTALKTKPAVASAKTVKKAHPFQVTDRTVKVYQVKSSNKKVVKVFKLKKHAVVKVGARVKALNGHRIKIQNKKLPKSQIFVTQAKQFTFNTKTQNLTSAQHAQVLKTSKQWAKKLTTPQKKAIYNYTSDGYKDINGYLRGLQPATPKLKREVGKIDRGLNRFKMPLAVTVWRGTSMQSVKYGVKNGQLKLGALYSDKAYMSTSLDLGIAEEFNNDTILKIQLPTGKHGAAIAPLSDYQSEDEFLVKHGAKLIVTGISPSKYRTIVTMNFVN